MTDNPVRATAFADAWIQVDQTDDPAFFIGVLDATRAGMLERARHSPAKFFDALGLQSGHRVLDVGCGTGDFLRLLAPLVSPGDAVGVDMSETMIAEARARSITSSGAANIAFQIGDVQALTFEAGSFDRVLATQVLLHVPEPAAALSEMTRVLARGGLLAISEIDWNSITIESSDRGLARRFTALACDELRNGLIVRKLPAMLRDLGFRNIHVRPEVAVSWQPDAFHDWFLRPSLAHFVRVGGLTSAEAEWFLHDLDDLDAQGRYFSARTTYGITAAM
jgi:ubiquinone/menaquinone biosynthesis C-methylase UbiE